MKKICALLLVFVMLLSLSACGSETDVRGEQTDNNSNASTDSSTDVSSEVKFSMGATNGLTYENKFIGIGCKLDESWTFYDDEQIKELNNVATEMAGEEYAEAIQNATVIYDMFAINNNQLDNININLEKINPIQLAVLDIAENYKNNVETIMQSYENMGYTNINYEIGTAKIGGKEFASLNVTAEINGIALYQSLISIKCNSYLASIAITTYQENTIDSVLANFYLV